MVYEKGGHEESAKLVQMYTHDKKKPIVLLIQLQPGRECTEIIGREITYLAENAV